MGKDTLVIGLVIALLYAAPAAATTLPPGFVEENLTTGTMTSATGVAFAPDGRKFVAEKWGRVRVVLADGTVQTTPLLDIRAKVNSTSDRGLLGIATDKDFATNGFLYLLYVYELNPLSPDTDAPMVSRLTRVTVKPDNTLENPADPETVILGTDVSGPCPAPDNTRDCIPADYKWHVIGTVRSDPVDGTLWLGTGDTHAPVVDAGSYRPYDERSFAGKLIHIDRTGRGLPNHPFCPADTDLTHTCTKIYAKGFRNPFRFTLRPGKGPVVGDVGNSHREEIDLLKPGRNYGWPCYEGDIRTPMYDQEARCVEEYAKEGTAAAATPPNWSYEHGDGATVVAGPVYEGARYPADYRGDIFVGDYVQGWVKRLEVDAEDRVTGVTDFASGWPTGVDLQTMPGTGDVAYVDIGWGDTLPAGVRKFTYTQSVNAPPAARASASPTAGHAPLEVSFTGSASSDPDRDPLTYQWSFGDGSPVSTQADPVHTYTANGQYVARLTVSDGQGHTDTGTVTITVGNTPPSPSIGTPLDESTYRDGQAVDLRGSATDAEDGSLPDSSYRWTVILHHATHVHEFATLTGSVTSFVPTTDHDADSYYEIRLTVSDSGGLQSTRTVEIRPETSNLTLASSPPGAPIGYADQQDAPAPFTKVAAVGFVATVSAASSFVRDGVTYRFDRWSDGGAAQHAISVPAEDTTLTATYVVAPEATLAPEADARVQEANPTTSYSAANLRTDAGADPDVESYLRFTVPSGRGAVQGAKLRVFAYTGTGNGPAAYATGTSWSETAINWGTRPPRTSAATDDKGAITANTWVEYDVTSLVTAAGTYSFALAGTSSDGVDFYSKEAATNRPQLVVTFSDSPPPPDTTPPSVPSLNATAVSSARVDLSWPAATDNVGVSRYEVERRSAGGTTWSLVATMASTVTGYSDTSVSPSTAYEYRVTAFDAAGNKASSNTAAITTPAPPGTTTISLVPEADAPVHEASPATNYATANLRTDGGVDPDVESYLRFTVPARSGTLQSAVLRLYAFTDTYNGPAVYSTGAAWTETGITWSGRPARTSVATADKAAIAAGSWVDFDVTPLVSGSGVHSFALAGTSSDGVDFSSREASAARPQLVLTYSGGQTPPPDTSPPTAPSLSAAAVSASRVELTWTAASDNVGVTGYVVQRRVAGVTTWDTLASTGNTTTTYADTAVAPVTTYEYRVKAVDGAQNETPSAIATAITPAGPRTLTVPVDADARVEESRPTTSFAAGGLRADGGADPDVESYLRFSIPSGAGTIQSVSLRVYATTDTGDGPAAYATGADWTESGLTWNTRPQRTSPTGDDKGAIARNTWVVYDLTSLAGVPGPYSVALATTSSDGVDFSQREAATNPPEVVVTYSG